MLIFLNPEDERILHLVTSAGRTSRRKAGSIIVRYEALADTLLVVLRGTAQVVLEHPDGRVRILSYLAPGCFFGYSAAFRRLMSRQSNLAAAGTVVRAQTDCEVALLTAASVQKILRECPEFAESLLRCSAMIIQNMVDQIIHLSFSTRTEHISDVLLSLPSHQDLAGNDAVTITQQELADMVGNSRVTVGKVLKELERARALTLQRNRIVIRNRHQLAALGKLPPSLAQPAGITV